MKDILTPKLRCYSGPMTTLTLELPDDIAQALSAHGDLSRRALEALVVDGYRQKTLTQAQVGRVLGLANFRQQWRASVSPAGISNAEETQSSCKIAN